MGEDQYKEAVGDSPLKVVHFDVGGMHCTNCAVLVERRLKELPHVRHVSVTHPPGRATVTHDGSLALADVQRSLVADGYTVRLQGEDHPSAGGIAASRRRELLEIAATFAILGGAVLALRQFDLLPRWVSVSDSVSLGLAFVIGLVASVSSCMAVTGGLLVAAAANYNAANPGLGDRERLRPHLYFNAGRLVSYALLGGVVGALGSTLILSPATNGVLILAASALMLALGLQMLGLFPSLAGWGPTMPKAVAHRLNDLANRDTRQTAFVLGGLTFFLPCGFTQALQLYVLAKGDFLTGALTMLAFALGTLPALLSLSALSSFASGANRQRFLRFAGAAVILLGVLNIRSGLVLTGIGMQSASATKDAKVSAGDGQVMQAQRIAMKVVGLDYQPNHFRVKQGVPVEWWIDASEADGCGRILVAPRLRIQKILSAQSTTLIKFTADQPGEYAFNCGMGMMTPDSKIIVLPKGKG